LLNYKYLKIICFSELKPQYEIHCNDVNVNTYPELLQGIYNFRPHVFSKPHNLDEKDENGCTGKPNLDLLCSMEDKQYASDMHTTIKIQIKQENKKLCSNESSSQSSASLFLKEQDQNSLENDGNDKYTTENNSDLVKLIADAPDSKSNRPDSSDCLAINQTSSDFPLDPGIGKKENLKTSYVQADFKNVLNMQKQLSISSQQKSQNDNNSSEIILSSQNSKEKSPQLTKLVDSSNKSNLLVRINRIKTDDVRLMQQSIKEFIKKSPEMARKMCLLKEDNTNTVNAVKCEPDEQQSDVTNVQNYLRPEFSLNTSIHSKTEILDDTFNIMKAHEKVAQKRKHPASLVDIPPEQIYSKPKVRKVERNLSVHTPKCSKDDVLRSQTYQQFMRNMEQIIELLDDTESPNFESDDVDENIESISAKMLNTMSNDVAKLKAKNVLDLIPKNKLTLLINYAMRNIYLAKNYSAGPDDDDEIFDEEVMEKILNAIEACLLICNIYSTVNDLKFLQEDNISLIIKFIQFQMRETIFPSYDSVYTVKSIKKNDNRKKSKNIQNHNRNLHLLYSKFVELMKVFVMLFDKCIFVDTIVLPLSTLAIEPFFVDNIDTLQFVCLELVTT
ncbi:hypothetical protein DOY81_010684, partial [Sarcophaga bullata]